MEVYLELAQPIERVEPAVLAEIDRVVDEVEVVEVLDIGCAEFEQNREELAAAFAEMLTEFGEGMLPSTISPFPTLAQFCSEDGFKALFDETQIDLAMDPETAQQMDDIWQAVPEPLEVVVDQIKELPGQLQKRLESAEDLTEPERESLEVALESLQRAGGVQQPVGELSSSGRLAEKHITENTLEEIASSLEKASRDTAKELARPAVIPHIREAVRGLRMELEPGDRLDLIKLASENSEDLTREDIEASASELRSISSVARGPVKILSLTAVALGVLLMAALGPAPSDVDPAVAGSRDAAGRGHRSGDRLRTEFKCLGTAAGIVSSRRGRTGSGTGTGARRSGVSGAAVHHRLRIRRRDSGDGSGRDADCGLRHRQVPLPWIEPERKRHTDAPGGRRGAQ